MKQYFLDNHPVYNDIKKEVLLNESLDGMSLIFNNSPSYMLLTDINRKIISANKSFIEATGFQMHKIFGKSANEIGFYKENEYSRIGEFISNQEKVNNEIVHCQTFDGKNLFFVLSLTTLEIHGKVTRLSSFLDITELKQQQQDLELRIEEKLQSLRYAQLVQQCIFPSRSSLGQNLINHFILQKPKDIVSGDFYWIKESNNLLYFAACDATGHGVPGAFISLIGSRLLTRCLFEYSLSRPADILNKLNAEFEADTLDHEKEIADGFDIALCVVDKEKMIMEYSGANRPICQLRNGVVNKLSVDKISINLFTSNTGQLFSNYQVKIESGDQYFLFSDGYIDQFGGSQGKKFGYKNFENLILSVQHLQMSQQKAVFDQTIEEWIDLSKDEDQTDDILVIGFSIP
ncbi:MAG: PAS domain S-box-containing protein [Vicingaceae bacterium]|jgi:PAS domain S-box-containing protein